LGRLGQLQQNVPEAEVRKFAEAPIEDYQIAVTGPMLDAFNQLSLASFQEKTFLTSKKNKAKKIALKKYEAPKDRQDGVAMFSFSRLIDGKPALTPEDDEIEFVAQGSKINLKVLGVSNSRSWRFVPTGLSGGAGTVAFLVGLWAACWWIGRTC
jgi:hypothetical protein